MLTRLPALCCILIAAGCMPERVITIRANPRDAIIHVDDTELGRGPIDHRFVFHAPEEIYRVSATLPGYKEAISTVTLNSELDEIVLELKRDTRRINILVEPAPAIIKLDGQPMTGERVSALSREIELTVDERNVPIPRTLTAERENFVTATRTISAADRELAYVLRLEPMRKNVTITTDPPGADIFLDEEKVGTSPLTLNDVAFAVDLETDQFIPKTIRAEKKGYDPATATMGWDAGQANYALSPTIKEKEVRLFVDPPGAKITIDGQEVVNDTLGVTVRTLRFPPINENGDLKSYSVVVSKKTDRSEWAAKTFSLAWEDGRTDYHIGLEEILTIDVPRLSMDLNKTGSKWELSPKWDQTRGMRDPGEPVGRAQPTQVTHLAKGAQINSLAIAPDGSRLVFVVPSSSGSTDFHSQIFMMQADGSGGVRDLSDGRSLDLMPVFTPGGDQLIFSSDRQGGTMQLWSMDSSGAGKHERLTTDAGHHFWPAIDSDPRPRLYWQAMADNQSGPRLRSSPLATTNPVDLIPLSATQPRVSPKNDSVLFCRVSDLTGKRDIFRADVKGGTPVNLTNTPDADECDPAWSRDGSKIIFSSDRAADEEGRKNYDIWMIDLAAPDKPQQLTANGSIDDCPVFDVFGTGVYFRSNRGGQWAIWRIGIR